MAAGLAGVAVAVGVGVGAGLAGVAVAVGVGVAAGLAGVAVAVGVGVGAGLAGVAVAVGVGVGAGLAGVAVAVGVGVGAGAGLAGVAVAVAVGVGAGLAERAAGVTTFASAESCMLTDSPEPRKPVTRTATTTRTRAAHMSAPHLRRLPGLAGPGGGQRRRFRCRCSDMAGPWLRVTNSLHRCRPPRGGSGGRRGM